MPQSGFGHETCPSFWFALRSRFLSGDWLRHRVTILHQ